MSNARFVAIDDKWIEIFGGANTWNITGADDNPAGLWSKSGAGGVTLSIVGGNTLRVTANRVGAVTITYRKSGITATANLTVV